MSRKRVASFAIVVALALLGPALPASALGTWTGASLTPTNPSLGAVTSYSLKETALTATPISCVKLTIDQSSSFSNATLPTGAAFNSGGTSTLGASWTPGTPSGKSMTWTGSNVSVPSGTTLVVSNISNPSAAGTYFAKIETFTNSNCSTGPIDATVTGFVITNNTIVSTHVQPTLTFTVAGRATACNGQTGVVADNTGVSDSVTMGHISSTTVGAGAQDVAVTTNAVHGAVVYVRGDNAGGNLRSSFHNFNDSGATPPSAGIESFGYTVEDSHRAMGANVFATLTDSNAEIAYSGAGDVLPSCIGYQASASRFTPSGAYAATVTYTVVPSY